MVNGEGYMSLCAPWRPTILFGLKRDEVTGDWRRLRNEELNDLYSSPNIKQKCIAL